MVHAAVEAGDGEQVAVPGVALRGESYRENTAAARMRGADANVALIPGRRKLPNTGRA